MRTPNSSGGAAETQRARAAGRRRRKVSRGWCEPCRASRHMLTVEYAADLAGLSLRQLFRHVEGGRLHFVEPPGGPRVCLESLCALTPQTRELVAEDARR